MSHRVHADLAARSRRTRALLAGGAVLGLGAVATLAAWSDDVWVTSAFSTSPFQVEASVDGDEWKDFDSTEDAGELRFPVDATAAMTPGQTVYAPLLMKVSVGDSDADVRLTDNPSGPSDGSSNENFFNALSLELYDAIDCSALGTAGDPLLKYSSLGGSAPVATDPLLTLDKTGTPETLCFKITLDPDAGPEVAGGSTGRLVWKLTATAISD